LTAAGTGTRAPWAAVAGGIRVRVRLTPKSGRNAVEGVEDTEEGLALKVRVRALPEDGAANRALVATLAGWLGVAKGSIEMTKGAKSRCKTLSVAGDAGELGSRIGARLATLGPRSRR